MKDGQNQNGPGCEAAKWHGLTPELLEVITPTEIKLAMAADRLDLQDEPKKLPNWSLNIIDRLRKTILKPVLKLKPTGNQINWRNYGRIIGVLERAKTFFNHDGYEILKKESLDKITDSKWAKIKAKLGLGDEQLRQRFAKELNRSVKDDEPLEKLAEEFHALRVVNLERHKHVALIYVSQTTAKNATLFYRGLSEGYTIFLNEEGQFCGERGRTEIYMELLACQLEVEKMRRMFPAKSRNDLYDYIQQSTNLPPKRYKWFRDICDEICLSTKGAGHPFKFSKANGVPVM